MAMKEAFVGTMNAELKAGALGLGRTRELEELRQEQELNARHQAARAALSSKEDLGTKMETDEAPQTKRNKLN